MGKSDIDINVYVKYITRINHLNSEQVSHDADRGFSGACGYNYAYHPVL